MANYRSGDASISSDYLELIKAIKNANAAQRAKFTEPSEFTKNRGAEAYAPEPESHVPDWLVKSEANQALDRGTVNDAAKMATIGGYATPEGLQKQDEDSSAMARDIDTSKSMMRMGGMQNSLVRKPNTDW